MNIAMNVRPRLRRLLCSLAIFALAIAGVVPQGLAAGGDAFAMRCSVAAAPDGPCCCGEGCCGENGGKCPMGCCRAAQREQVPDQGIPPRSEELTSGLALPAPALTMPTPAAWALRPIAYRSGASAPASLTLLSLGVRINA